jgi:uncharacterized protein (TIGR00288 family)
LPWSARVSPWWLRPPGEENDEPEETAAPPATREPAPLEERPAEHRGVPSIADLIAERPGQFFEEIPERENERYVSTPPGSEEVRAFAEDATEIDVADNGAAEVDSDATAGNSEPAEKSTRRRRRRGGRGRGRGGAAAANSENRPPSATAAASLPDWEEDDEDDEEEDSETLAREVLRSMPVSAPWSQRGSQAAEEERKIAMFCDLENVALGVRDSEIKKFDIHLVLERLVEKGKIIVKRAYADWERYSEFKVPFHEAAIELIDIPQRRYTGKNSADIKMVVDAMDLCYSKEHLDTFVLLSGDSDFSPLVSKLKENNKYVIGVGVKNSSSNLLIDNCDEFVFYEDVWRDQQKGPELTGLTKKKAEVFTLMTESILALQRENKDVLWGSMVKQTMQRKKPSFNEGYYGYSTFSELLQDAERNGIVKLRKDERSGSWVVTGFAKKK